MDDKCIVCGKIVPEGRQVCGICEKKPIAELIGSIIKDSDNENQSAKADAGKPILSLVPKEIIYEIEKVRSFGVKKYKDPDNWKYVEIKRYHQALLRHTLAIWDDIQARDEESGMLHLSHIATNVAFLLEMLKVKEWYRMKWEKQKWRIIKRLAVFPMRIGKEYRWLEIVYIEQNLFEGTYSDTLWWGNKRFVSKSEYLEYKQKNDF